MKCDGVHAAHLASCQAGEGWGNFWKHDGPAPEFTAWVIVGGMILAWLVWRRRK